MTSRRLTIGLAVVAIGLLIAVAGCTKKSVIAPKANERPVIELTRAPFNESTRFEYSYRMNWLGFDPDGRVEYFLYAIDPPSPTAAVPEPETTWVKTTKSERLINFSATKPDSSNPDVNGSSDFHTFVVKAIDNGGLGGALQSSPLIRSFFTYTIAPTVQIQAPSPTDRGRTYVTPSVRIDWTGTDDDGILDNKKPVKYKYILLTQNTPVPFQVALSTPDSVRRYYAPRNWAGWDSTTADTLTHQFTNLVPSQDYLFCIVAFDEAGAYSPVFSLNSNMLNMRITYAAQGGPQLTVFNEFFFYQYNPPVYSTLEQYIIKLELPAQQPITFNWIGVAGPGADVRGYRWALDIDDLSDQTPRTNEREDLRHWSQESSDLSATIGTGSRGDPQFQGGEIHLFYIEAVDNNGLKSLATIRFVAVQSTLSKLLLVVKDVRFPTDQKSPSTVACMDAPKGRWPYYSELDSFLFARGGFPWRCYPAGTISRPGLFSGYPVDTIGTRVGQSEVRVPLARLGNYSHVIWMTDGLGAVNNNAGTDVAGSITALRYMSSPGRANSLAAYIKQGGEVWLVGGGCAYATTYPYNKLNNDTSPPAAGTTFSNSNNELIPGRFMYDLAHWQSEIKITNGPLSIARNLGRHDSLGTRPLGATPPEPRPEYNGLPLQMRPKALALGDTFPPNRTVSSGNFYYTNFELEYMSQQNRILEDIDPSLLGFNEQSTLDTLYSATGQTLMPPSFNRYNVCMTRYVGPAYTHILFTGFSFWSFAKVDCQALIDGVVRGLWGIPYTPPGPAPRSRMTPTTWTPPKPGTVAAATPLTNGRATPRASAGDR